MGLKTIQVIWVLPLALLLILSFTRPSSATVENAKKMKKACTVCHIKIGSPDLTDAGKYYKEKRTMEGYESKEKK